MNTFAFGIQKALGFYMADISFFGKNTIAATLQSYQNYMTNANFVQNGARDSRYSPYAGICIDPFGPSVPADGGYPGLSSYYDSSITGGSTFLQFDRVGVSQFVVGFMVTPNGQTQNAENICFNNCVALFNKVGVATSQPNQMNVRWSGGSNTVALYCFDGNNYGEQRGPLPAINGANCSGKYLLNVHCYNGLPVIVRDLHAESFASIGFIGPGYAIDAVPAVFEGCSFSFSNTQTTGIFADLHLRTYAPTKFVNCIFGMDEVPRKSPLRLWHYAGLEFDHVVFANGLASEPIAAPTFKGVMGWQYSGVKYNRCYQYDSEFTNKGESNGRTQIDSTMGSFSPAINGPMSRCFSPIGQTLAYDSPPIVPNERYFAGQLWDTQTIFVGTKALTLGSTGSATFTATDPSIIRKGDYIYNDGLLTVDGARGTEGIGTLCIGYVSNIVGATITISGIPQSLAAGTYNLHVGWMARLHEPSTGNTTNASNSITSVTNPATWVAGHRIKGIGIPVGAVVTAVSGSTVTISKSATATAVGVRLYDADIYKISGVPV